MTSRTFFTLSLLAGLAAVATAQSRDSLAITGVGNLDYALNYIALSSGYSDTGEAVGASVDQSFSGFDGSGSDATMRLTGQAYAQSNYGRLRTSVTGRLENSYYHPDNTPYFDGETIREDGSPDSMLIAAQAGFTDVLSFGGGAMAGYSARYVFFIEGLVTGDGMNAYLSATIGDNEREFLDVDLSGGRVAQYYTTDAYEISSLREQEAVVSFTTRFDANPRELADGTTLAGSGDFSSTVTLAAINVYDENGRLVTTATAVGASGTVYSTEAVPEPASMAALGLGALALMRRRRKAAGV